MKEAFNIRERRYSIGLRSIQLVLITVILISGLIGANIGGCSSKPAHFLEMTLLSIFLVSILVCHHRLIKSLELRFYAMYETHKLRLNLVCAGLVLAVGTLLTVYVMMQLKIIRLSGAELITGHLIGSILPITAYVLLIDATEDCFDCFNRSKDQTGGA